MNGEFSRKELYDLVWSQPMKNVAATIGISDVALAKHCKKANIPVPSRGYWAQKQAGKPTVQVALSPRFPGASDRIGGASHQHYSSGSDWAAEFLKVPVPPVPTFDEDMISIEKRARALIGKIRCQRKFEPRIPWWQNFSPTTKSVGGSFLNGARIITRQDTTLATNGDAY